MNKIGEVDFFKWPSRESEWQSCDSEREEKGKGFKKV